MRAATHANVPGTVEPFGRSLAWWPLAFLTAVVVLLGAVVYLCAVVSHVLAPEARTFANSAVNTPPSARAGIVEGGSGSTRADPGVPGDAALDAAIRDALARHPRAAGVAVVHLGDGRWAAHNADKEFYAASTFKLAVLYEVERRVSAGELSYDDRLALTGEDIAEDLGTLDRVPMAADGTVSIGEALEAMVTLSDNATAVALMRLLSPAAIDATLRELGMATMSVNAVELPATAGDLASLMRAIVEGVGVAPAQREHMRDLLVRQATRDGIPAAVGRGAVVGNKTGTWPGVTNDVAFVETADGTYVMAIMAEGDWNWELIRDVSGAVSRVLAGR